jgi:hypothetical protein
MVSSASTSWDSTFANTKSAKPIRPGQPGDIPSCSASKPSSNPAKPLSNATSKLFTPSSKPSVSTPSPPHRSTQSTHQRVDSLLLNGLLKSDLRQNGAPHVPEAQTLGLPPPSQQVPDLGHPQILATEPELLGFRPIKWETPLPSRRNTHMWTVYLLNILG